MHNKPERKKEKNLQWDRVVTFELWNWARQSDRTGMAYGCSLLSDMWRGRVSSRGERCQQSAGLISPGLFSVFFISWDCLEILCCKTGQAVDVPLPFDSIPFSFWGNGAHTTIGQAKSQAKHVQLASQISGVRGCATKATSYPHERRP